MITSACSRLGLLAVATGTLASTGLAGTINGRVDLGGSPLGKATVALWATNGTNAPTQIATATCKPDGTFILSDDSAPAGSILYLVARSNANDAPLALLSILGADAPNSVVVNELTTVASAFTANRFIEGEYISGNPIGLQIAAANVGNFVDPTTGTWGETIVDPINLSQNTTLARFNTLGSLVTAFGTTANDGWRSRFLQAATPTNGSRPNDTIEAIVGIAQTPWANPNSLFTLFQEAFPTQGDQPCAAPFMPCLAQAPSDFAMILCFADGGISSPCRIAFDANGNAWTGQQWMAGSQSNMIQGFGGGLAKISPCGKTLSPAVTGFDGTGGIGWGTAVTPSGVWTTSIDGDFRVTDFNGTVMATKSQFPFANQIGSLAGVGVAPNGDVWIADAGKNQLLYFPGGSVVNGRIVQVPGLVAPFAVAIDAGNRVCVSNGGSNTIVCFPLNNPSKSETFTTGFGVRGVAFDSKGNLWAASNTSPGFQMPTFGAGTDFAKQCVMACEHIAKNTSTENPTGTVCLVRNGSTGNPAFFSGNNCINVPWSVSVDGNDDVWVANCFGRGITLMAGAEPRDRSAGRQTGEAIHTFRCGSIQMATDASIDAAGNVWVANCWNDLDLATGGSCPTGASGFAGGTGVTVIFGAAAPVQTPLMGQVRAN